MIQLAGRIFRDSESSQARHVATLAWQGISYIALAAVVAVLGVNNNNSCALQFSEE